MARGKLSREMFLLHRDEQETETRQDDSQTDTETGHEVSEDGVWHRAATYPGPGANPVRPVL